MRLLGFESLVLSLALASLVSAEIGAPNVLLMRNEGLHQALLQNEGLHKAFLRLRSDPPTDWSDVPRHMKFPTKTVLEKKPGINAPHISYRLTEERNRPPAHVLHYEVFKPHPDIPGKVVTAGRWRGNQEGGKTHANIKPPVWHPTTTFEGTQNAYPGTPRQKPPMYDQAVWSKSIFDKVKAGNRRVRIDKKNGDFIRTVAPETLKHKGKAVDDMPIRRPEHPNRPRPNRRKSADHWRQISNNIGQRMGGGHMKGGRGGSHEV